jgi:hypothetical protein
MVLVKLSIRYLFLIVLGALLLAKGASAQDSQTDALRRDIMNRANKMIDMTMKALSTETNTFNTHISDINKARPLELTNFDSVRIADNISNVVAFLGFLKTTHTSSDSLAQGLEDTMFALKNDSPGERLDKALQVFSESFTADRTAFNDYLTTLDKLYGQVLNVLLFMQHAKYTIAKGQLEFRAHDDVLQYKQLMRVIDKTTTELQKASAASRQATEWANKKITDLNAANKESNKEQSSQE